MSPSTKEEADRIFQEALAASGARDPRDFYRGALRELKDVNAPGYDEAVHHFRAILVPGIASGKAEPLRAWREYGRLIAQLTEPGTTVEIDDTGLSRPFTPDSPLDRLVLHLPHEKGKKALLVSLPPTPTPAQRAAYDLLARGKLRLPDS